ncbi:hypothetical protein FHS96_005587 [Sphingomonas zeicaulis]|uniref:hypothetical protein n=1 Tax=Sphingomonas zeicaulis TaxID=1632740 RepID=UPI003D1A260F
MAERQPLSGFKQSVLGGAEPQGEAAILLVESLIHGLIARSVISAEDALEIVTVAIDVCTDIADVAEDASKFKGVQTALQNIALSLSHDV